MSLLQIKRRKSHPKPTLQTLERRIERLERKKAWPHWLAKLGIPAVAVVVAFIGLRTSQNAIEISRNAYDLNVEPVVYASIHLKRSAMPCTLYVENQGINPIYDVRVRKFKTSIDPLDRRIGGLKYSSGDWHYREHIDPRDTLMLPISSDELIDAVHDADVSRHWQQSKNWYVPVVLFYTSYRRMPDKRLYRIRTLLYPKRTQDSSIMITTEDDYMARQFTSFGPMLDSAIAPK